MKSNNAKIRNATVCKVKGITFKSSLEKMVYNTLLQHGIEPQYEPTTFTLWEKFRPITPFYDQETPKQRDKRDPLSSKMLILKTSPIEGIKYTPDFYFKYGDLHVYIEAKGIENDVFYIKKKMFRYYLDQQLLKDGQKSIYFEIYTKKQLLQALKIIEDYGRGLTETDSDVNHESSTKGHSVGKKVRRRKEL